MSASPDSRRVVAMGGGGFSMNDGFSPLDALVLELARASAARRGADDSSRPRVCFIGTAGGDAPSYVERFQAAFDDVAETSHLGLFDRQVLDIDGFLGAQDAVYVGGGNTANMLAIWRLHGVDTALRRAWERGVVMAGISAGAICWFEAGTTDSFGPQLAGFRDGLGILPGSMSPHFDGEPLRRPLFHRLIGAGELPVGLAADDGAALVFHGTTLGECVSEREPAACYRLTRAGDGAHEERLPVRRLS
ncbi:MAG TPA: peptidase E [Candidatus Limnocylindrales bacterium]